MSVFVAIAVSLSDAPVETDCTVRACESRDRTCPEKRAGFRRGRGTERKITSIGLPGVNRCTGVSVFGEAGGDLQNKYMHVQGVAWHV